MVVIPSPLVVRDNFPLWRIEEHFQLSILKITLIPYVEVKVNMKILGIVSTALMLLLGAVGVHAQGWNMASFPDGIGMTNMMYRFVVPEGVTVTNKKGEVMKAGSVATVPGSSIKLLDSGYAKKMEKDTGFMSGFVNAQQYFAMPAEKVKDHSVVSLKVPEGVTVEGYGKKLTGGSELILMISNTGTAVMPDTNPADYWNSTGWEMK